MFTLGIDIGSTTTKAVLMEDGKKISGSSLVVAGIGSTGLDECLQELFEQCGIKKNDIAYTVATGYGRNTVDEADGQISELSGHARGAFFIFPKTRTIIDIGGQDAKVITLSEKGLMEKFVMNDKCAAGTGRFLDVMANVLKFGVDDYYEIYKKSEVPVAISNTCTVFAESEVISRLANGYALPDIVSGICDSVAGRVAVLAKRLGIQEVVCMSGGVAHNGGVRKSIEKTLGVDVLYSPMAQLFGAIGAALHAYNLYTKENKEMEVNSCR